MEADNGNKIWKNPKRLQFTPKKVCVKVSFPVMLIIIECFDCREIAMSHNLIEFLIKLVFDFENVVFN